ncbi:virulence factor SrfC family protein [uncultured Reyranella sp.]|uniref:virulence factor SrfC family protein n=1 Tax=uncultured Reyranella sp. TaxID=735512 RepID=UPI00259CB1D3|nr:virulence factor SrfC family protein [uncultured Reyranella sp.]
MDTVDLKLAQDCEALAVTASEGVAWLRSAAEQSPTVAQQAPSLVGELQKVRNQSRKLARAARRRMCVGVFGPSQAGKSYLVSILASRDGRPLQARFADKAYDFLREINPPGNRESTGLVTRFGLGLSDGSTEFPVRVRLLTQTDIVKILGNSFLLDFDHQKAEFIGPDGAAIRKRLTELRAKAHPAPVGDLESDDVLDLIEYFDTFFAGVTAELRTDYWREAIDLAPRLSGTDRARLWSVLWYDFQPFTDLYLTLYDGLQKLGHAPEALLGMDALIPREKSIVDVLTLDRLGADGDDTLLVRPRQADGRSSPDARLPRSLVCALTAELNVAIDEKPWDFFDHTDLLDFPGARSRLKLANLDDVAKTKGVAEGANPLRELLLRGKVAYLFQRYSAERELSAILLCIPDGNQEVRDLSDMMTAWIDQTIGATPADRAKQKNALFLVLTKMDREFEQKAGETEESRRLRWSARLGNSLVNNFRGEWPLNWNGKPFDNSFWLRNPTVIDERLMEYDGGREVGIADSFAQRAGELRRHFVENEDVRRHFANPALAWDEAFRANDGGVAYLVKSLIPVCDPAIKRAQVRGQLDVQLRRLVDRLAGFHSASDGDARAKKRELIQTVLRGLANVIQQQLFGELVAALQVADTALREIYFRIATAQPSDDGLGKNGMGKNGKLQPAAAQSTGAAVDIGAIFADVFGEETGRAPPPSGVIEDRAERFAREAAEYWLENMRRVGADEKALSHFGVDRQHLGWLIDELIVGAHRLKLIDQLSHEVRELENAANAKWEEIAERQVRTASSALNGYVSALGFDKLPLDQRPGLPPNAPLRRVFEQPTIMIDGIPQLSENPAPIYADYCKDWMRAFLQLAMDNVGYEGGREITPEQNDRLGAILRTVAA